MLRADQVCPKEQGRAAVINAEVILQPELIIAFNKPADEREAQTPNGAKAILGSSKTARRLFTLTAGRCTRECCLAWSRFKDLS